MIADYIQAALDVAHYEIIDNPEPYYGEVSALPGVYATGETLKEEPADTDGKHEFMVRDTFRLTIPNPCSRPTWQK